MRNLHGKVVALSGAGSGIGRELALALSKEGAQLALSDIDGQALEQTLQLLRRQGEAPHHMQLDVADRSAVFAWADTVVAHFGRINMIINNAGVSLNVDVDEMSIDDFQWLMNINFWGVVHGTQAFLPHLKIAGEGHIVNISSIFGLMAIPSLSAYNSSKFAVRGFTEALSIELRVAQHSIAVTCALPGGIRTNIARSARVRGSGHLPSKHQRVICDFEEKLARNSAAYCAKEIVQGIKRDAARVIVGGDARLFDFIVRLIPGFYINLVANFARRMKKTKDAL